jgi:hypothetical protein
MLVELGTRGWISPPQVLKYMHLVETDRMYDESLADDRQVSRENDKMMEGGEADMTLEPDETGTMQLTQVPPQPFPINEWDNDVAHIAGHEAYMKTQQYELAAEPQKQVLLEHLMAHKQRYQTQQMQAMQMAQPQGPPPIVGMGRPSPTQPAMPSMPPGGM